LEGKQPLIEEGRAAQEEDDGVGEEKTERSQFLSISLYLLQRKFPENSLLRDVSLCLSVS